MGIHWFHNGKQVNLTLSWRKPIPFRNQSIDLLRKSMYWFLYDIGFRHERVKKHFFKKRLYAPTWWESSISSEEYSAQHIVTNQSKSSESWAVYFCFYLLSQHTYNSVNFTYKHKILENEKKIIKDLQD